MQPTLVYIGTGPISVIDASFQKKHGNEILLIDDKEQVGGAWVAIDVGDYGRLEIGCHIWSYNKKAYAFMASFFELNLVRLNPQPYISKGDVRLTYDRKNIITTLKRSAQFAGKLKFRSLVSDFKTNPAMRFPIFAKPYLYPMGGARDLQNAVVKKIKTDELATRLNTTVTQLDWQNDQWLMTFENGEKLLTNKIVMTATSSVKEVNYQDKRISIEHRKLNYTHYHLIIEGEIDKAFSYVRVLNHEVIHRISDVTNQLSENKKGYKVVLVGVFDEKLPKDRNHEETVAIFTDYLINKRILNKNATVVYAQKNKFETSYIPFPQIKEMRTFKGLEVLATTDLMYSVYSRLPEWQ